MLASVLSRGPLKKKIESETCFHLESSLCHTARKQVFQGREFIRGSDGWMGLGWDGLTRDMGLTVLSVCS